MPISKIIIKLNDNNCNEWKHLWLLEVIVYVRGNCDANEVISQYSAEYECSFDESLFIAYFSEK